MVGVVPRTRVTANVLVRAIESEGEGGREGGGRVGAQREARREGGRKGWTGREGETHR